MSDKLLKKRWTPIAQGVALQVIKDDERSEFKLQGLAVPDSVRSKYEAVAALVVAVGPEVKQVKRGDLVLLHPSQPLYWIDWSGDHVAVVTEDRIAGIVDEASDG